MWPLFPPPLAASHAAFCARTTEAEGSSRSPTSLSKVVPVLGVPNVGVPALDGAGSGALPFPLSLGWAVGFPGEGLDSNCSSANLQRSSLLPPCDRKRQAMGQSCPGCRTLEAFMQANAIAMSSMSGGLAVGTFPLERPRYFLTDDWRP